MNKQDRLVTIKEAVRISGRSESSLWRDEQEGRFPKRVYNGPRSVRYRLSEINSWMDSLETVTTDNVKAVAPGVDRGRKPNKETMEL